MPTSAVDRMKSFLPYAAVDNPVDMTAQIISQPELVQKNLEVMLEEGGYGAVAVFLTNVFYADSLRDWMLACFANVRRAHPDALIGLCTVTTPEVRSRLEALGYVVFDEPTRMVDAIAALVRFRLSFSGRRSPARPQRASSVPAPVLPARPLNEFEAMRALAKGGFPVVGERLAGTRDAAVEAGESLGYPVALKIASPDIPHKTEIGGVELGLGSSDAVGAAFDAVIARARNGVPDARIDGVVVARMAPPGVETILGTSLDPVFGPVVLFGLGGIFVEVLRDVSLRVAPFDVDEAHRMIGEIRGAGVLDGARGRPAADKDALARALARLSDIAAANAHTVESIDINPFVVLPRGPGRAGRRCADSAESERVGAFPFGARNQAVVAPMMPAPATTPGGRLRGTHRETQPESTPQSWAWLPAPRQHEAGPLVRERAVAGQVPARSPPSPLAVAAANELLGELPAGQVLRDVVGPPSRRFAVSPATRRLHRDRPPGADTRFP